MRPVFLFVLLSASLYCGIILEAGLHSEQVVKDAMLNPSNVLLLNSDLDVDSSLRIDYSFPLLSDILTFHLSDSVTLYPNGYETAISNTIHDFVMQWRVIDALFIDVGKMAQRKGVGYFKQPTDFLFDSRLSVDSKTRSDYLTTEGTTVLHAQVFAFDMTFDLFYAPVVQWPDEYNSFMKYLSSEQLTNRYYITFNKTIYGVDIEAAAYYDTKFKAGLSGAYVIGDSIEIHAEVSIDEAYNSTALNNTTIPLTIDSASIQWMPSFIIGGHYTFPGKMTVMAEYYFNGKGLGADAWNDTLNRIESTSKEFNPSDLFSLASLGTIKSFIDSRGFTEFVQHYSMLRFSKEYDSGLSLELININNLVDASGLLYIVSSMRKDGLKIIAIIDTPYGAKKSEFGMITKSFGAALYLQYFLD